MTLLKWTFHENGTSLASPLEHLKLIYTYRKYLDWLYFGYSLKQGKTHNNADVCHLHECAACPGSFLWLSIFKDIYLGEEEIDI